MNVLLSHLVNVYFLFFLLSITIYDVYFEKKKRNSAVGRVTGYGLDGLGIKSSSFGTEQIFLLSTSSSPGRFWGSPNLLSNEYRGLFPGFKRPRCEADHSLPNNAEVKNMDL
jgi:hypothetical protein